MDRMYNIYRFSANDGWHRLLHFVCHYPPRKLSYCQFIDLELNINSDIFPALNHTRVGLQSQGQLASFFQIASLIAST